MGSVEVPYASGTVFMEALAETDKEACDVVAGVSMTSGPLLVLSVKAANNTS